MSTDLAQLSSGGLETRHDDAFNDLTIQGGFLPRLGLYSGKSKIVELGKFPANHWGVTVGKDKLNDVGEVVNAVPLAYRPMALDLRGKKAVAFFDPATPTFKEVKDQSLVKDSKCMAGIQFLIYVQNFGLTTYFCASKSAKMIAGNIRKLTNKFVAFSSHTVQSGDYVYRAPLVDVSNVQFDLPVADILKAKEEFINIGPVQVTEKDQEGDVEVTSNLETAATNRPR